MKAGIEAIHAYGGRAVLDVRTLFDARGLDASRFANLLMEQKAVSLPCEDPVTNAVNAAKPIVDALTADEKGQIELVIVASESGLDFGKSMAAYVHAHLGLSRRCRQFEVKQACYAGTAALQMAASWLASGLAPGAKALVVATDVAGAAAKNTYAEPSQGTGAVAMLVSETPHVLTLDLGANGYHSYEVMDTCRPAVHLETGDPDLSLLSYLDCLESSYADYASKTEGADYQHTFDYLVFHTPFAGMVKGAHRTMMRRHHRAGPAESNADFDRRVGPSLHYCVQVGNVYSATLYLALCGLLDRGDFSSPKRVGLFSYGSGCASEFYSGVITQQGQERTRALGIGAALAERHLLTMTEYDELLDQADTAGFGVREMDASRGRYEHIYRSQFEGRGLLVLERIRNYHREYRLELMAYSTLRVSAPARMMTVTLARPAQQNAINALMLRELHAALDVAERTDDCHAVVLEGGDGVFCDGMDFEETGGSPDDFMQLLRRFAQSSRIIVSAIDGRVVGGGVGIAAASDLVVATPRSQFSLPETLWGLLPACVLPYLMRRIGFQRSQRMALTTQPVPAAQALEWSLVDEVADTTRESVRRLLLRAAQVHPETVAALKRYTWGLSPIGGDVERRAVEELTRLLGTERARTSIAAFLERRSAAGPSHAG